MIDYPQRYLVQFLGAQPLQVNVALALFKASEKIYEINGPW